MKIGINCGHTVSGQAGCGAVGFIDESVETRNVGKALITQLKAMGHTVYDCTNDYATSTSENLSKIVSMANAQTLDLFVSIHFNAGGGQGTEVFTYGGEKHAEAVKVCEKMNALGFKNRGVKDGSSLYVVRHTNAKAMLIEVCFVDTQSDVNLYKNIGADKVVATIAGAITGQTVTINNGGSDSDMEELKALEKRVQTLENPMIYNYVDENMPEFARPTIQKLMDKGILKGEGSGLNLNYEMLRILVINDRAGIYD